MTALSHITLGQKFQSTLRRTERRIKGGFEDGICYFNPRSGERSDANYHINLASIHKFQSTLRRTERHSLNSLYSLISYFNPRSGERSDDNFDFDLTLVAISIHAPANGATS